MMTVALRSPNNSLLGTPTGELVLRVRGTSRDGQEVRLTQSRCTVGSAPGCTLRLVAQGVQPRHCLLLRGVRGTIVRSLAPDTRLNGRPFADAAIKPGDLLGIGPVEFEVVGGQSPGEVHAVASEMQLKLDEIQNRCNLAEAEREYWEQEARDSQRQRDDLRTELASERAVRQLGRDSLQNELTADREQLQRDRQAWEERRADAERELAERARRSTQLAAEQADALEADRQRNLEESTRLVAVRQEAEAAHRVLAARQEALELQTQALQTQQAEWEAERNAHCEGTSLERSRLNQIEATLAADRDELDRTHQDLAREKLTLAAEQQRLNDEREQLAAARQAWEGEQAELAAQREELSSQQQRFAIQSKQLTADRQQAEQLHKEAESQLQQCAAELDELTTHRAQLAADRESLAFEQQQLATAQDQLITEREQLTSERDRITAEREQVTAERDMLAMETSQHRLAEAAMPKDCLLGERESPVETQTPTASEQEDGETTETTDVEPKSNPDARRAEDEDVFARLRALSLLREGDDKPLVKETRLPAPAAVEPTVVEGEVETPAAPLANTPVVVAQENPREGEESIDDYMSQLFARLNGGRAAENRRAATPPPPVAPASPPSPQPAHIAETSKPLLTPECPLPAALEAMPVEQPAPGYLTEMPRRAAPAQQINLSAMRELANLSANSAIGASQRRRWTSSAAIKLGAAAGLGTLGIGILLFALGGGAGHAKTTLLGFGAVLFVAGAVWLLQGLALLLMASRSQGGANRGTSEPPRSSNVVKIPQVVADADVVQDARQAP